MNSLQFSNKESLEKLNIYKELCKQNQINFNDEDFELFINLCKIKTDDINQIFKSVHWIIEGY